MSTEVLPYTDPLLELLKDPNLNKEKEKTQELVEYIEEIKDSSLKSWCIESFEILRDLEKIEVKLNNWEFQTLDFNISVDSIMMNEKDVKRRKFNLELAKRVSKHCLDLHNLLGDLSVEIDELSSFSKRLSPIQKISDPGTILTELNLRVIRLQNILTDQISIHYSRARLVNMGISLEDLVHNSSKEEEFPSESSGINNATVKNYKQFVNNLLQQLNKCVSTNDTIGAMECIAIVNDVEKMFLTMKAQRQEETQRKIEDRERKQRQKETDQYELQRELTPPSSTGEEEEKLKNESHRMEPVLEESPATEGEASIDSDTDLNKEDSAEISFNVDERRKRRLNNDKMSVNLEDSVLHKTTLAEKLPFLMSAFDEAKAAELGLKEVVSHQYDDTKTVNKKSIPLVNKKAAHKSYLEEKEEENREEEGDYLDEESLEDSNEPTMNIPSYLPPLGKPSILNAFFQPKIMDPIYISTSQQTEVEQKAAQAKHSRYMRRLTGSAVKEKLLKYQQNEQLRDLSLSTDKLTSIEVGRGRVKETVKEIEQQLPTGALPPSPVRASDSQGNTIGVTTSGSEGDADVAEESVPTEIKPIRRALFIESLRPQTLRWGLGNQNQGEKLSDNNINIEDTVD
ncbi:hypothetical protein FOA43_000295 [Brettanomyces nanus]|uniref:Uncharacterized protein n=1 Tax=Eeniella nana TaxID=13502 RepID=A0A875RVK9_EENNA|nr:uncharacterized protein FOA43_000295 [Brettanomyces nanus]QPG72991.1 hypothetical protein FOA43_000295 [Brettanomyces nanus]